MYIKREGESPLFFLPACVLFTPPAPLVYSKLSDYSEFSENLNLSQSSVYSELSEYSELQEFSDYSESLEKFELSEYSVSELSDNSELL